MVKMAMIDINISFVLFICILFVVGLGLDVVKATHKYERKTLNTRLQFQLKH